MPTQITVLSLPATLANGEDIIHPVVLHDEANCLLVDTGLPGMASVLFAAMESLGLPTHILLTHADMDHVGSLAALLALAGHKVEVLCHEKEKPYVECDVPPLRLRQMEAGLHTLTGERLAEMTALVDNLRVNYQKLRATVTRTIADGEPLPCGAEVLYTPGHTPGHICLYHKESRTLIAGDMLNVTDGELRPAPDWFAHDRKALKASLVKLTGYDIETVVCYHGGEYRENVNQRIRELTQA
jgi:glyoxylase-like metal-dependent hydrolase (beta-lactamase superfamily II)